MARLTLDVGDGQHVLEIQDVGIEVHAIHAICAGVGQVRDVCVADVVLDLNILERNRCNLCVDALGSAILIPTAGSHLIPLNHLSAHRRGDASVIVAETNGPNNAALKSCGAAGAAASAKACRLGDKHLEQKRNFSKGWRRDEPGCPQGCGDHVVYSPHF